MSESNRYIHMSGVRRDDQRQVMEEIQRQGHCPFCRENLHLYHQSPILREGAYWILTENQWPYEKVKHQLLAIYKTHIEALADIAPEAGAELIEMFGEESKKRHMSGGGVAIRFGTSEHGNYGSSVNHIHAHLIEPDLEQLGETEAWKFKFGQPKGYHKAPPEGQR